MNHFAVKSKETTNKFKTALQWVHLTMLPIYLRYTHCIIYGVTRSQDGISKMFYLLDRNIHYTNYPSDTFVFILKSIHNFTEILKSSFTDGECVFQIDSHFYLTPINPVIHLHATPITHRVRALSHKVKR